MMTRHVTPLSGTSALDETYVEPKLLPRTQVCHIGSNLSHFLGLRKSPRGSLSRLVMDEAVKAPCLEASGPATVQNTAT